ncbi:MAG: amidohydrolase, partial [Desulfatitalea sp.]|nr:amidohydrolase [Desulfatitalea sp.]NNJ99554.1 amidohydrolase [Desulfatitalea sp.]
MSELKADHDKSADELVRLRRMFHQHPEPAFCEYWTTARICEHLDRLNCTVLYGDRLYAEYPEPGLLNNWREADYASALNRFAQDEWIGRLNGRTGAAAIIKGRTASPRIGFRFDIDALPVTESADAAHLPFRQGFRADNGFMHACGHDGHITMGLGLAEALSRHADQLNGTFYLFFQPAEETAHGGRIFSKLPLIKPLDYLICIHVGLSNSSKIVCALSFLADKRYQVVFEGRKAHAGAFPEQGQNALLAACQAVTGLYAIERHSLG